MSSKSSKPSHGSDAVQLSGRSLLIIVAAAVQLGAGSRWRRRRSRCRGRSVRPDLSLMRFAHRATTLCFLCASHFCINLASHFYVFYFYVFCVPRIRTTRSFSRISTLCYSAIIISSSFVNYSNGKSIFCDSCIMWGRQIYN